jgi:septum formation protein
MDPIILASGSLQRQEYFRLLGLPFKVMPSLIDENLEQYRKKDPDKPLDFRQVAEDLAKRKVDKVANELRSRLPPWIVGADTLITADGAIYGKPENREDAEDMLRHLQGRDHEVVTAVALFNGREDKLDCRSVSCTVSFAALNDKEIEWYLNTGEWQGAAGAYKIQGLASCFISRINGSYSSVVGLPIHELYVILRENGYHYGA